MKEQLMEWLDDDGRDYKILDHEQLNWMIQLKHGERTVLMGNPMTTPKRLEVVYKLSVSEEHKRILKSFDPKVRSSFERGLVMLLAVDSIIYNIRRDSEKNPDNIVIKKHLYEDSIDREKLFEAIQLIINVGMRTTIHFQSLGGAQDVEKDLTSTKPGPSLYR